MGPTGATVAESSWPVGADVSTPITSEATRSHPWGSLIHAIAILTATK